MTVEEARQKIIAYCDNEIKNSGFLGFDKNKLELEFTRILEPYMKEANLPLPDSLSFTNDLNEIVINSAGVKTSQILYAWLDIYMTAIKIHDISKHEQKREYNSYLIMCLTNGNIIELELGNLEKYCGLVGHFIEQFKLGQNSSSH